MQAQGCHIGHFMANFEKFGHIFAHFFQFVIVELSFH